MFWFIGAFFELSTDRQSGFGVGPIPWSAIKSYAEHYDFKGSDFGIFHDIVRAMDAHYVAQKETETKSGNSSPIRSKDAHARETRRA